MDVCRIACYRLKNKAEELIRQLLDWEHWTFGVVITMGGMSRVAEEGTREGLYSSKSVADS